jgi:hypothetical protein
MSCASLDDGHNPDLGIAQYGNKDSAMIFRRLGSLLEGWHKSEKGHPPVPADIDQIGVWPEGTPVFAKRQSPFQLPFSF